MKRGNASVWSKRVKRWKGSGLTAKKFAAETGLNASTLTYWSWRLGAARRDGGKKPPTGSSASKRATLENRKPRASRSPAPPAMVELPIATLGLPVVEIFLPGDVRVQVSAGIDTQTLEAVMLAIGVRR